MSEGTQLSQEVRQSLAWDPYWLFKAVQNLPVSFTRPLLHLRALLQQLQVSPGVVVVFCCNQKSWKPNYSFQGDCIHLSWIVRKPRTRILFRVLSKPLSSWSQHYRWKQSLKYGQWILPWRLSGMPQLHRFAVDQEPLSWASLVAQWLRICLPVQGTWVRALVWEDPTCCGATGPVSHNYWACASGACAPQQERPRQWEARAPRWRVAPTCHN